MALTVIAICCVLWTLCSKSYNFSGIEQALWATKRQLEEMNKNLDLIAGFLEGIRDKMN